MKIAVAGAAGALGSAVVGDLRTAGHDVSRLVRGQADAADEMGWDPSYGRIAPGTLDGFDAVVNLYSTGLAGKRWNAARKRKIHDSRVVAARTLASAVAESGVPVFLSGSETAYYGDTGTVDVDESAGSGTGFHAELCRDWEAAAREAEGSGTRVVLLRLGTVLAADSGIIKVMTPAFRAFLGFRFGRGDHCLPWVAEDDAVAAVRFVLENESVAGPVNVTAPGAAVQREFAAALGRALRRPVPWSLPRPVLRAALGEYADGFFTGRRAVPSVLTAAGFGFRHPDLDGAIAALFRAGT
ncbi:TIGR01777 family oxidoreductase [Streptomyces atrovirens]|uniref:TIGR01777 family oxidoreductase n=1 Tax=Streptomyces atrovirens TaxID=285556 RepID=A0ABW0DZ49_9ACTN